MESDLEPQSTTSLLTDLNRKVQLWRKQNSIWGPHTENSFPEGSFYCFLGKSIKALSFLLLGLMLFRFDPFWRLKSSPKNNWQSSKPELFAHWAAAWWSMCILAMKGTGCCNSEKRFSESYQKLYLTALMDSFLTSTLKLLGKILHFCTLRKKVFKKFGVAFLGMVIFGCECNYVGA